MQQEQPQVIPAQVYFVPPPINELNKNYHQQLSSADNPVHQATKGYVSYNELYRLDQSDAIFQSQMVTQKLKESLKEINKVIYSKMIQYLASLSGHASLENIKNPTEFVIKQQILKFMQICQSVKRYETKKDICSLMAKQTALIRTRTNEILTELQQVKEDFQSVSINERQIMRPE